MKSIQVLDCDKPSPTRQPPSVKKNPTFLPPLNPNIYPLLPRRPFPEASPPRCFQFSLSLLCLFLFQSLSLSTMRKNGVRVMAWWEKMVIPMRRAWVFVAGRVAARRNSGVGLMKLHKDVETCGYEDVLVMWEMLRSEMRISPPTSRRHRQPYWRLLLWANPAAPLINPSIISTANV